jgi:hypothetical protein
MRNERLAVHAIEKGNGHVCKIKENHNVDSPGCEAELLKEICWMNFRDVVV